MNSNSKLVGAAGVAVAVVAAAWWLALPSPAPVPSTGSVVASEQVAQTGASGTAEPSSAPVSGLAAAPAGAVPGTAPSGTSAPPAANAAPTTPSGLAPSAPAGGAVATGKAAPVAPVASSPSGSAASPLGVKPEGVVATPTPADVKAPAPVSPEAKASETDSTAGTGEARSSSPLVGSWAGAAGVVPITVRITGNQGERLTGVAIVNGEDEMRMVNVTGSTADSGARIVLSSEDGSIRFEGKLEGRRISGVCKVDSEDRNRQCVLVKK